MKTLLSYTTLADLHVAPHTYYNKIMGVKKPESDAMNKGSDAHKVIQRHVSKQEINPKLVDLWEFPRIEYHCRKDHNDKYTWHGFMDGVNFASKVFLEIKSSKNHPMGQSEFNKLIQPKYYSFVSGLRKVYFISCNFDLSTVKTFYQEYSDEDIKEAEAWALKGLDIIESGAYLEDKTCDGLCSYRENCLIYADVENSQ